MKLPDFIKPGARILLDACDLDYIAEGTIRDVVPASIIPGHVIIDRDDYDPEIELSGIAYSTDNYGKTWKAYEVKHDSCKNNNS